MAIVSILLVIILGILTRVASYDKMLLAPVELWTVTTALPIKVPLLFFWMEIALIVLS